MHKPEFILENETHKILRLWHTKDQTVLIEKKTTCQLVDFAILADKKVKR